MKKLKTKVFWVIFSLLTIFTIIIITTSIVRNYMERKKTIGDIITKMPRTLDFEKINNNKEQNIDISRKDPNQGPKRIYLDFTIYRVVLNKEEKIEEIINYTNNDNYDEEKIKNIASKIISNYKEKFYIGNLYTNKYSYIFNPDNTLIIMDNTKTNKELINQLIISLLLFILCETTIFIITSLITKWIITPVKNSFEKQKVFVADASHELKTPLSVMIASADCYLLDKDEKWVINMKNESERMIKLVTELLDLAKTEEEQDIIMENNNISDIIEGSILTFESLFYDNKIKLDYDIEKNINMLCNENQIVELMSILIDNAIKHCKEKGKVIVNLKKRNKQIELEVKNTGLPIKKEEQEKIFERY